VLFLVTREHSEDPMRRTLHTLASVLFAASLVLLGYTVNDLSTGLTELPEHWWSTGAAVVVIASGCAALLTRNRPATRSPATG
jgi:peptidoglycan/LPS O-acetylase OafA/YrhL